MNFVTIFERTGNAEGHSTCSSLSAELEISPGIYGGGLISVLNEGISNLVLSDWRWLLGQDAIAVAASGIGDLFFWSPKHEAVFFLEVQRGISTFIDKRIDYVFNEFLTKEGVQNGVLHKELIEALKEKCEPLDFGECFIAQPWQRMGGSGDVTTYGKGELGVYASLVAQAVKRDMDKKRGRVE